MISNHIQIDREDYIKIKPYARIQGIAKDVMADLLTFITPGITEKLIAERAIKKFQENDIKEFWYYDLAALVLIGSRTILSVSGRDYVPTDTRVQNNDLVTIDLGPMDGDIWGDYARSIYIEDGVSSLIPKHHISAEGYNLEMKLHSELLDVANPEMTAHELWLHMNEIIERHGFENLDFKGNLGHSIEKNIKDRRYIEKDNHSPLKDFGLFTFEPHIRKKNNVLGFKHENIHFFAGNKLQPL